MNKLHIYTDGGARNNPGPAALGIVILDENKKIIKTYKKFLGKKTNNQAEYNAVITALRISKNIKPSPKEISFFLDSELVCRQINRQYKIKNPELKILNKKIKEIEAKLNDKHISLTFHNVPRENIHLQEADALVNEALDEHKN